MAKALIFIVYFDGWILLGDLVLFIDWMVWCWLAYAYEVFGLFATLRMHGAGAKRAAKRLMRTFKRRVYS